MTEPLISSSEIELRAHIERVLSDHYELDREIGRGGMGIVYRGRDRRLKRHVAIKILPPELGFRSEIRSRFLREAETAAQLSHPNIVPIYSVDEQQNLVFFVMSCVEGENIARHLHERGRFDADQTRYILREVADALAYAHSRGVVHRDIKPDNIIIEHGSGRPLVTDFGIARAVTDTDSRLTATGIAIGTPAFMSPEQSMGEKEIDGRSDLYSLGVVGYQMLSGDLPFRAANTPAMLMKHISETPHPLNALRPELPPDLVRAIMILLEKDPENRFPSAEALVVALDSRETPQIERRGGARNSVRELREERPLVRGIGLDEDVYEPSVDEVTRWNASSVLEFRRKFALFAAVNIVIVVFSLFTGAEFLTVSLLWSVYIAYKYAGLWSAGFDWRDVFRQPRHRTLLDLTSEAIDELGALSDPERRRDLRERSRRKRLASEELRGIAPRRGFRLRESHGVPREERGPSGAGGQGGLGHKGMIARAASDRDEILRLISAMPKADRARMKDVAETARALFARVDVLGRIPHTPPDEEAEEAIATIDREIRQLEAEANPLDAERSDTRVRRLAFLKRQRRTLADASERSHAAYAKLEDCCLALRNIRLDVIRLSAGKQSFEQVTLLAEQAILLAREVDGALGAAEEVARGRSREK